MRWICKINEKLKKKYWHSEWEYQYVVGGLIGFGISFIAIVTRIIKSV